MMKEPDFYCILRLLDMYQGVGECPVLCVVCMSGSMKHDAITRKVVKKSYIPGVLPGLGSRQFGSASE